MRATEKMIKNEIFDVYSQILEAVPTPEKMDTITSEQVIISHDRIEECLKKLRKFHKELVRLVKPLANMPQVE